MQKRFMMTVTGLAVVGSVVLMGAGFPTANKVPPKQWAGKVCTAIGDWVETAEAGGDDAQAAMEDPSDVAAVRDVLADYLGDMAEASDDVAVAIRKAGVPDTPKGKQAQAALIRGFRTIGDALDELAADAEALDTTDPNVALSQLTDLNTQISTEMDPSEAFGDLESLDPGRKLERAFDKARACNRVFG